MPHIALPSACGRVFDSWDQPTSGMARAYWLGAPPDVATATRLAEDLAAWEILVHEVTPGRRFGVFTFLSASGPTVIRRPP